ncbi:hypothetical protein BGZ82_004508 [Podila clonocystis]|nr:hypothetical protein BGZ82_004508 [Podila clonocystis]
MQRQEDQVLQHQPQPLSSSLPNKAISERHDVGPLSDFNPLQPQQQPSFQSNRSTSTPVPYDSGNIESPALPPTDGTFTTTTTATPGRKPSLVEGILTTAATAASTAVEAARSLVSHEDILEEEAKDAIKDPSSTSTTTSSSLFPLLGSESHHGLEFKQRRLSVDKSKKETPVTVTTTTATQKALPVAKAPVAKAPVLPDSPAPSAQTHGELASNAANAVTQWLEATKAENEIQRQKEAALSAKSHPESVDSKDNIAPVWPLSDDGADISGNGTGSIPANPGQGTSISANTNSGNGGIDAKSNANSGLIAMGAMGAIGAMGVGSGSGSNPNNASNSTNANANAGQASGIPTRAGNPSSPITTNPVRSNSQSSSIRHNTIYVAGQGPESLRHGSMGVDQPAVSSSYQHHHRNSSSGMGVDQPLLVGQPRDPKEHRKGGLQVDTKHPDDTHHHEVHQPHDHEEEAKAAATTGAGPSPLTGRGSVSGRDTISGKGRRGSISGLNVDPAPAPSKQLAGSGSNEATHRSGSYNSGINVDKAGSGDHKRSGMGVDGPALSSYHMAATHDAHLLISGRGNKANNTNSNVGTDEDEESVARALYTGPEDGSFMEARGSGFGEGGAIQVNRYSSSSQAPLTVSSTTTNPNLEAGSSSHLPRTIDSTAGHIVTEVPADYHGPLPQVAPGEQVMWVKKVIQTDYYEDGEQGAENPPQKRSSMRSFLDRLRGRKSTGSSNHNTVDKGKQRQ